MPRYAWPRQTKILSSICSSNRYVPAYKKLTLYLITIVFEILKFRDPTIWLAESIKSRIRFFPDIQFKQNHKGYYGARFKSKKSTDQFFLQNLKNSILVLFWGTIPKTRFFTKNPAPSVFTLKAPELRAKFQKNSIIHFGEKGFTYWPTGILTVVKS